MPPPTLPLPPLPALSAAAKISVKSIKFPPERFSIEPYSTDNTVSEEPARFHEEWCVTRTVTPYTVIPYAYTKKLEEERREEREERREKRERRMKWEERRGYLKSRKVGGVSRKTPQNILEVGPSELKLRNLSAPRFHNKPFVTQEWQIHDNLKVSGGSSDPDW